MADPDSPVAADARSAAGAAGDWSPPVRAAWRVPRIMLPWRRSTPWFSLTWRILAALAALVAVVFVVQLDRNGYHDNADGSISVLDAIYYATVSLSTTGYGDIVPVSDHARLLNVVIVTPLRFAFLAILVGTTVEVLTLRTREAFRLSRWRSRLDRHTIIVGYGTKGRSAINTLLANGEERTNMLVIDTDPGHVAEANRHGLAGMVGDGTRSAVLREAHAESAKHIIIATDQDATAVLTTLTVRQLNPTATVAVAVREAENEPLLKQSGASTVVTSSESAGRLLGYAALSPAINQVMADLLVRGTGIDIVERPARTDEYGRGPAAVKERVIAVLRGETLLAFEEVEALAPGDRLVLVVSSRSTPA